jgi:hypothetical protein
MIDVFILSRSVVGDGAESEGGCYGPINTHLRVGGSRAPGIPSNWSRNVEAARRWVVGDMVLYWDRHGSRLCAVTVRITV